MSQISPVIASHLVSALVGSVGWEVCPPRVAVLRSGDADACWRRREGDGVDGTVVKRTRLGLGWWQCLLALLSLSSLCDGRMRGSSTQSWAACPKKTENRYKALAE